MYLRVSILGLALGIASMPAAAMQDFTIDFGADDSAFAQDGECDDPRFVGLGMSAETLTDNIGRDASDCRTAFSRGNIELNPLFDEPMSYEDIEFGDDAGDFANDGDCDDIRFTGDYATAMIYLVEDIGHDASDCRAAVQSGVARWQGATADPVRGIEVSDLVDTMMADEI